MQYPITQIPTLNVEDLANCTTALQLLRCVCALLNMDTETNPVYQAIYKARYWRDEYLDYVSDYDYRIVTRVLSAPITERRMFQLLYLENSIGYYARRYAKHSGIWASLINLKGV